MGALLLRLNLHGVTDPEEVRKCTASALYSGVNCRRVRSHFVPNPATDDAKWVNYETVALAGNGRR
jgi:hypothetical protein